MNRPITITLAVVAVLILAASWLLRSDPTQRNYQLFPNMVDSPAYAAFSPISTLPPSSKKTAILPEPGKSVTMPRPNLVWAIISPIV